MGQEPLHIVSDSILWIAVILEGLTEQQKRLLEELLGKPLDDFAPDHS